MARDHARIKTAIWNDTDWAELPWYAQWLYQAVLSQPLLSYCGVVTYTAAAFADLAAGTTVAQVRKAAKVLQDQRYIFIDPRTAELWCRTFVRHDGLLKQPNLITAAASAYLTIRSADIRDGLQAELLRTGMNPLVDGRTRDGARRLLRQIHGEPQPEGSTSPFQEGSTEGWPPGSGEPPPDGSGEPSRVATRATPTPTPTPTPSGPVPNGTQDRARHDCKHIPWKNPADQSEYDEAL